MRQAPHSSRRSARSDALRAAKRAGQRVRSAVVEPDGKVTLTFGDDAPTESGNEWDERLNRGKH